MSELTVGILGTARGMTLARLFDAHPSTRVTALCDRIDARREHALTELPHAVGYQQYEDMLGSADRPDIVVVASEPMDHARHSCMALEAGCAVLSEVPAIHTLEDAQTLVDTVERTRGFYMFGENCNYYNPIHVWKRFRDEGVLGDIVHAEGEYIHDIRSITWLDTEGKPVAMNERRSRTDIRPHWRADYDPIRYVTHSLGPVLWLMETRCTHVSCMGAPPRAHETIKSPDIQVAIMSTEIDAPIRQTVAFSVPHEPGRQWFSIYGTKAHVEWKRAHWDEPKMYVDGQEVRDMNRMDWPVAPDWLTHLAGKEGHGGIDAALVEDFVDALYNGKPSPIDVHTGLDYSLPGVYAAMSAHAGGKLIRIPNTRTERIVP
jgi:predicted dehydrogenase